MNNKNTVVLAGDYAYIRQIETALKSLCYHNRQLKIYLLIKIFQSSGSVPRESMWRDSEESFLILS